MIYCCYGKISCISDELTEKIREQISCHYDKKINMKNKESVVVKYALCRMLEQSYNLTDYRITADDNGKPFLENETVYFSLSHSGDMFFCVVSDKNIGCDVQKISEFKERIAKRFFTHNEYVVLMKSFHPDEDFTKLWTLKEAVLKYKGDGISGGLSTHDFSGHINESMFSEFGLNFTTFVKDEYVFSVCSEETEHCLFEFKMGGD